MKITKAFTNLLNALVYEPLKGSNRGDNEYKR